MLYIYWKSVIVTLTLFTEAEGVDHKMLHLDNTMWQVQINWLFLYRSFIFLFIKKPFDLFHHGLYFWYHHKFAQNLQTLLLYIERLDVCIYLFIENKNFLLSLGCEVITYFELSFNLFWEWALHHCIFMLRRGKRCALSVCGDLHVGHPCYKMDFLFAKISGHPKVLSLYYSDYTVNLLCKYQRKSKVCFFIYLHFYKIPVLCVNLCMENGPIEGAMTSILKHWKGYCSKTQLNFCLILAENLRYYPAT